ncbi:MAG: DUF4908 domain-containing protein [Caulobacteraceae bacterium]|nr:DUF4908 domain-containing protein [Caulobacteraceae bacterium]
MASTRRAPRSFVSLAAMLIAGGMLAHALPAAADPGLREAFSRRPADRLASRPPVARYMTETGEGFILDRTNGQPLLKFDSSMEVMALQAHPGPRGDVIYKNDLGSPVLRATRLGGLTVFTHDRPGGSAAALVGSTSPLRIQTISPNALFQRLYQASAKASKAAKRLIPFEADATPGSSSLVADAAGIAAEAIVRLSNRADGRRALARLNKVTVVQGRKPAATVQKGVARITIAPADGWAGRPSSERIILALTD